MRNRLLFFLLAILFLVPKPSRAATPATVVSSTCFQDAQGNCLANGTLTLALTRPAQITSGGQVAPIVVQIQLDSSGLIPVGTQIWANSSLNPSGTGYAVTLSSSSGLIVSRPGYWVIQGTSPIDLAQEQPVNPFVSFPNVPTIVGSITPGDCAAFQTATTIYDPGTGACGSGGGGGSTTFDKVGSGTNSTATMICATGCAIGSAGGIINATKINNVTVTGTPTLGQIPIASDSTNAAWGDPIVSGHDANGSAPTANPVLTAGWDGTLVRTIKTDTSGDVEVVFPSTPTVTIGNSSIAVTGTFWQATQPVSVAATVNTNLAQVGGAGIALGQTTMTGSIPVVIASNQSNLPVSVQNASIAVTGTFWQATQPVSIAATLNTTDAANGSVTGGAAGSKSELIGGQFNSALPSLTNGQQAAVQVDSSGRLLINCSAGCGGGSGGTSMADEGAFTPGTTSITPIGGIYSTGSINLVSGQAGILRLTIDRRVMTDLDEVGGSPIVLGQTTMASSIPVTIASNQSNLNVVVASALPAGSNTIGAVTQASGPWTQNITQVAGSALGAPSNYGTSPGAVSVIGVNAFITNTPAVSQSGSWTVTANAGTGTFGVKDVADMTGTTPATAPANTQIVGEIYNTAAPTPTNGQTLPLQSDSAGRLIVSCGSGCGGSGGTSIADLGSFTQGTTSITPIGGIYTTSVTNLTSGQAGALRLTNDRNLMADLNEVGGSAFTLGQNTSANSLSVVIASDYSVTDTVGSTVALNGLNVSATVALNNNQGTGFFLASGTLAATLTPEVSYDGGTTWSATQFLNSATGAVTSTLVVTNPNSATVLSILIPGGVSNARVRVSSFTSGTANGTLRATLNQSQEAEIVGSLPTGSNTIGAVTQASGPWSQNITQVGGSALALGQTTMSASIPVVLASNQSNVNVAVAAALPAGGNTIGAVNQGTTPWVVKDNADMTGTTPGTAPSNTLIVGQIYNSAAPTPTTGQTLPLQADSAGRLIVDCGSGCGGSGGTSMADEAGFTQGTTSFTPIGGYYNTSITNLTAGQGGALRLTNDRNVMVDINEIGGTLVSVFADEGSFTAGTTAVNVIGGTYNTGSISLTSGQAGALRLTADRRVMTDLEDVAGAQLGAPSNYGTSPGAVAVLGVNAFVTNTVAVSGTVTANAGTGTFGTKDAADMTGTTPGTAPSNTLIVGEIYNSAAPTPTTGQTLPLQADSAGRLIVSCGSGCGGSGGTSIADEATFTQGTTSLTPIGGIYVTSVTNLTAGQAGAVRLNNDRTIMSDLHEVAETVLGAPSNYGTSPGAVAVIGVNAFITNTPSVAQSGTWNVTVNTALPAGTNTIGKIDVLGNSGNTMDAAGQNQTSPAAELIIGGQFNTSPTTITSGNVSPLQLDANGNLKVNLNANTFGTITVTGTVTANAGTGNFSENLTQVNSVALGSPSNYGTSPGAVSVLGVNAFVTNTIAGNITQIGGSSLALGQTTMSASIPVVIASNQSSLPVSAQPSTSSTNAATTFEADAVTTSTTVKSSAGNVYGYYVYNPNSSACFLEVFNTTTPTLGTTTPILSLGIPATSAANIPASSIAVANFSTAIAVASTTASKGASTCGTGMTVNVWYQ